MRLQDAARYPFDFRYLSDVRIQWRYVLGGAAVTAFLFAIGRQIISMYLKFFGVGSAYGAAGSVIVVLLWIYYSAQIFFLVQPWWTPGVP